MSEELATRGAGALVGRLPAPVHRPGELALRPVELDADQCWDSLGATLRTRIEERAGPVVDWWAWAESGRVHVCVLGAKAFVRAVPTTSARGPAHRVETMRLASGTARTVTVAESRQSTVVRPQEFSPTARIDLPVEFRSVIGHLPQSAQLLLQEPFIGHVRPVVADAYVYRIIDSGSLVRTTTTQLWCYLTDLRTLTVVSGSGVATDHRESTDWSLTCRRVSVGT